MENKQKNVKISDKHHEMLKIHCEKSGLKIYKVLEKFIEDTCKPKKKDIYGESQCKYVIPITEPITGTPNIVTTLEPVISNPSPSSSTRPLMSKVTIASIEFNKVNDKELPLYV